MKTFSSIPTDPLFFNAKRTNWPYVPEKMKIFLIFVFHFLVQMWLKHTTQKNKFPTAEKENILSFDSHHQFYDFYAFDMTLS